MSDILRADELKSAKDAYELWLKLDRTGKKAAYKTATAVGGGRRVNRGVSTGFVQPFGTPENFWYETKVLATPTSAATPEEESATALIAAVVTATAGFRVISVPVGPNNLSNLAKKIQFAKAKCTERSGAGAPTTSRITKLPYTKYNTNTVSNSFGVGNSTQSAANTEPEARRVITNLLMAGNPAGRFVSFTSQGFIGNVANAPAA